MCRHHDDPFCCEFHDECGERFDGHCVVDEIDEETESHRQAVEAARQKAASAPTPIGVILENAAPPDLILSKFKKMLKESGAAIRIIRGKDGYYYAMLGPFECADNYLLQTLSGGAS